MVDTLEGQLHAMRARLSKLSYTVGQHESEEQRQRRMFGQRHFPEERSASPAVSSGSGKILDSMPAPPSSGSTSRPLTPSAHAQHEISLTEREVNQLPSTIKVRAPLWGPADASCPPTSTSRGYAPKPVSGVMAMLQLARHHATAFTCEAPTSGHTKPSPGTLPNSVAHTGVPISAIEVGLRTSHDTSKSLPTPLMPGGVAGLYSYRFQEQSPNPSHRPLAPTEAPPVSRSEDRGTPYKRPCPKSHDTATDSTVGDAISTDAERSFDAFRVVQERLRQKMKQLTTRSPEPLAPRTAKGVSLHAAASGKASVSITQLPTRDVPELRASDDGEDSSPSPRPPHSTRAETATPTRSPSAGLFCQCDNGNASIEVEVCSGTAEPSIKTVVKKQTFTPGSREDSTTDGGDEGPGMSSEPRWLEERLPATGVETATALRSALSDPIARYVRDTRTPREEGHTKSAAREQRCCSHEHRRRPEVAAEQRSQGGRRWSEQTSVSVARGESAPPRRSGSRHVPSSMSAARSSARREGSAARVGAPRRSAPRSAARSKPISLNVEATILCAVSGAELLALLRMRGLIESDGDTEEYRLPPTRCHRLYVTAEEHQQLKLLRQSLHFLVEEEKRQDVPSYQRVTVSARSRNAEFITPLPVVRYMDV